MNLSELFRSMLRLIQLGAWHSAYARQDLTLQPIRVAERNPAADAAARRTRLRSTADSR